MTEGRLIRLSVLLSAIALLMALPMIGYAQSDDGGFIATIIGSSVSLVCCIAWFIIDIVILIWVYNDANTRGNNGCLWAIIVLLFNLLGLLLYLALGRTPRNNNFPTT